MILSDHMRIQIASFALVPDHIFIAERNFHTEKLVLILSEENKEKQTNTSEEIFSRINEVVGFYEKLNVLVEKVYVNYKNFKETTVKLARFLNRFSSDDQILLNLSGGRRSIPFSLIYAGTFISNFKDINIKCVVIPEDKTYTPFNLLPNYLPDKIDINLMLKLPQNLTLTDLEKFLGIKQPTISMRLKRLKKHGFIIVKGRKRELTDLGRLIVNIKDQRSDPNGD
ncbi:unnamed protein product [marine sediment metagenome]|uniref:HTH arsR-type domain-containing protein n=1 Tax=marine sediment metagenome TaxID=412755 RepID=X1SWE3_9ZZZZ